MGRRVVIVGTVLYLLAASVWLAAGGIVRDTQGLDLLHVSYDPTRELWRDMNERFIEHYHGTQGARPTIRQSHGGSTSQARSVLDGLDADLVSLALWNDVDALQQKGLVAAGWDERKPPYYSTIVFVVRRGNPRQIKDWPDLVRDDVSIITPNPKTSGNGKLSLLAAWGAVLERGGAEADALTYITELYRRVPVLDSGARGATTTFAQKGIGDVHLAWENEAQFELAEANGALEVIYPSVSIRAEPPVAVVTANAQRKGTYAVAEAYVRFLYTEAAQEIIARHHYRPGLERVLQRHGDRFPGIRLFEITRVARDWNAAQEKFFAEGGVFDRIYQGKGKSL